MEKLLKSFWGQKVEPYCTVSPFGTLENYKYVVVLSEYEGKLLLSRHKERKTWETQGGHIEPGETPLQAAQRELFEESEMAETCAFNKLPDALTYPGITPRLFAEAKRQGYFSCVAEA